MILKIDPEAASEYLAADAGGAEASKGPFGKGGALEWAAVLGDAVSSVALSALHAFDEKEVQDSSKNLQVLWARALLSGSGELDDDVAYDLLPESTRGIFAPENVGMFKELLPWVEWIQSRTRWIDSATEKFLSSAAANGPAGAQVVVYGAGFDTRSLRFQRDNLRFFEVDLPDTIAAKRVVHNRFAERRPGARLPELVGFDLNNAVNASVLDALASQGFRRDVPTLFIWEAVLFYVEPEAIARVLEEAFTYGRTTESMYCLTDSLRPFVQGPFVDEVKPFLADQGLELLEHTARWGGAVHFVQAASDPLAAVTAEPQPRFSFAAKKPDEVESLREHAARTSNKPINTYAPAVSLTNQMEEPSFEDTWYAVAYSEQLAVDEIFPTRLWGEPIVLYRDADGAPVALRDVCPHRSAPLSMGDIENGELRCFYHGWAFGKRGECADVPTIPKKNAKLDAFCATSYAIAEHEGLLYVWRGNPLAADARKLPSHPSPEQTLPIDTTLDYGVDWSYIVENNLDSPHLYWLHDGSIPPLESLGFVRSNISKVNLRSFKDDIGYGHIGKTGGKGLTKVIRYDAPNVVRHCGVSGFSEEFHIVPIAPHRTRVLLRQRFPKGPLLTEILKVPGSLSLLTWLVRNWNYHISLEDYSVMQGQAHNIDDLGAPNFKKTSLGDDLIVKFWDWNRRARADQGQPYFRRWDGSAAEPAYGQQTSDSPEGTYGLKKTYVQDTPIATYAPINYTPYKDFLDACNAATRATVGAIVSVPAAVVTYKSIAPAIASMAGADLPNL